MPKDLGKFGSQVVGGFNRRDVLNYIKELSNKQDELTAQIDAVNEEKYAMEQKMLDMEREMKICKIKALTDADAAINNLENEFINVKSDMETTANHVRNELGRVGETLALLTSVLENTSECFNELRVTIKNDREQLQEELK